MADLIESFGRTKKKSPTLNPVIFRDRMVSPWAVWCEFVWVFCVTLPLVLSVVEAKMWHILLATFLPNWADLTCGLTTLCAVMITSATVIFAVVFVCLPCIVRMQENKSCAWVDNAVYLIYLTFEYFDKVLLPLYWQNNSSETIYSNLATLAVTCHENEIVNANVMVII